MGKNVYELVSEFKQKYPLTIAWRLKQNSKVVQEHLNPDEYVIFSFAAQKNDRFYDIFTTGVVAVTNKRIIIGRKRKLFGYFFDSITPDLFNDLKIYAGFLWGKVQIDTVKELITLTNIDKRSLPEIETQISSYMMNEKQKYLQRNPKD